MKLNRFISETRLVVCVTSVDKLKQIRVQNGLNSLISLNTLISLNSLISFVRTRTVGKVKVSSPPDS